MQTTEAGSPINITASGIVSRAPGTLLGFYVNSTDAGTLIIRDGITDTSTALSGTITPAIGFRGFPVACVAGCYFEIGGTALDVTAFFAAG